jgi:hypothetical protein
MSRKNSNDSTQTNLTIGAAAAAAQQQPAPPTPPGLTPGKRGNAAGGITVRTAGGLQDMRLPVSPRAVPLAKAINLALTNEFLETPLDDVYASARVRKGVVEILHGDYFGLGDGLFASIGKVGKSIQLTFRGPDPASPEGKKRFEKEGRSALGGLFNVIGRKMDLLQEFEDQVPTYVEQMLDRLEAAGMIFGWSRDEWEITTKAIGLDVILTPVAPPGE